MNSHQHKTQNHPKLPKVFTLLLALAFLGSTTILAFTGKLPFFIVGWYVVLSIITIIIYGLDKSAAVNNHWRINEKTLHLLSLFGGWPGALIAQNIFRHKTRKPSFQIVFWITLILNGMAIGWLLSPYGETTLRFLLNSLGNLA